MDGTGVHWLQRWYCGARLAALTFPPAPFLSPAGGEEGGGRSLSFPWPPASPPLGARKGEGAAFPSPSPLHRFVRRSACSFPPLPYTDDLIDERSVAWGDR